MNKESSGAEIKLSPPDLSEELQMLKESASVKIARNVRQGYEKDNNSRGMYRSNIRLNVERNRLLTESFKAFAKHVRLYRTPCPDCRAFRTDARRVVLPD
ncbi:MAG: hypothetical protein JRF25_09370 [Deltaproteobacteria bacterium]|nr:hypothetical protein [Deltaproteobacteria bacterium]